MDDKTMEIVRQLNLLEAFILRNAYTDDWDGNDQETGMPIIFDVYIGLTEEEIKNLLKEIGAIIQLVKEVA